MEKFRAIKKLYPNVVTMIDDVAYDVNDNEVVYDENAVIVEMDKHAYKDKRVSEYPSIGDQLDALFHAGVFPQEMADKIQAVKTKYPKGSE